MSEGSCPARRLLPTRGDAAPPASGSVHCSPAATALPASSSAHPSICGRPLRATITWIVGCAPVLCSEAGGETLRVPQVGRRRHEGHEPGRCPRARVPRAASCPRAATPRRRLWVPRIRPSASAPCGRPSRGSSAVFLCGVQRPAAGRSASRRWAEGGTRDMSREDVRGLVSLVPPPAHTRGVAAPPASGPASVHLRRLYTTPEARFPRPASFRFPYPRYLRYLRYLRRPIRAIPCQARTAVTGMIFFFSLKARIRQCGHFASSA